MSWQNIVGLVVSVVLVGYLVVALVQWLQSRPSAAGNTGWNPTSSGASHLGPSNPDLVKTITDLVKTITDRRTAVAAFDSVPGHAVTPAAVPPPDAVTASGFGRDPDISPGYAREQAYRVAKARGLNPAEVVTRVQDTTTGRILGSIGEPIVNVLDLNVALQHLTR
ncbi:MAG TPA: potassium-transporting ATPase subunit C [Acidimicrobiales bacterium]